MVIDKFLQHEIDIVLGGLASVIKANDSIMMKSGNPAFGKANDSLSTLYKKVETSASVLTSARTQNFRR